MAENDEMPRALLGVTDSLARAAWTFVRNGVDFHQQLLAKVRKVADAALASLDDDKAPQPRAAGAKSTSKTP